MIPLLSVFAIPIASCLSTTLTLGRLFDTHEILMVAYLPQLKKHFLHSLLFFSFLLPMLYVPLVLDWAPSTYFLGKRYMVILAKDRLTQLESGTFHIFLGKCTLFFKRRESFVNKKTGEIVSKLMNVIVEFERGEQRYRIVAEEGFFEGDFFIVINGSIRTIGDDKSYLVTFKKSEINLHELLSTVEYELPQKSTKYLSWNEVKEQYRESSDVYFEFHVRIVRIIWQFFFPFLAALLMLTFATLDGNNLLKSIAYSIGCVFVSYVGIGFAQSVKALSLSYSIALLYGSLIAFVCATLLIYRKKSSF